MDKPTPVTYELNVKSRNKSSRVYHRNSLKPYLEVKVVQVKVAIGLEGEIPLPETNAGSSPGHIISLQHLNEEQQQSVFQVLDNYQDVLTDVLQGPAKLEPVRLQTMCPYPVTQGCYQVPEKLIQPVKDEIHSLLQQGIIQESSSPWNSPAVIVKKPNGRIRLCVNFQ